MHKQRLLAVLVTAAMLVSAFGGISFATAAEETLPAPYAFFEVDQTDGSVTVSEGAYLRRKDNVILTQEYMSEIPNGGGYGYRLTGEGEGFHLGGTFLTKVPEGQDAIVVIEYYIDGTPKGNMFRLGGGSVINQRDFHEREDNLVSRQNGLVFYTMTADKIYGKVSSTNQDTHIRVFGCENGANVVYIKSLRLIDPAYYYESPYPGYEYYDFENKTVMCPYYPDVPGVDRCGMGTAWEGTHYRYFTVDRNKAPSETENRAVFIRVYTTKEYQNTTIPLDAYQVYNNGELNFNGLVNMPGYNIRVQDGVGSLYIPAACFRNSLNTLGSFRFWYTDEVKIARVEVYDVYTYCTSPQADPAVVKEMHKGALRARTNVLVEGQETATPNNPTVTASYRCAFCGELVGQISDTLEPTEVAGRLPRVPTADGAIAEAEWGLTDDYLNNYNTFTVPNNADKVVLDGTFCYGWTKDAFCFAATAQYAIHSGDALQLVLNDHVFRLALEDGGVVSATVDGVPWGDRTAYAVRRKGNTTVYEVVIPSRLFDGTLDEGRLLTLSYALEMYNGYGYEWYGGLSREAAATVLLGGDKTMSSVLTETLPLGDVECSGRVDSTDARMILQYAVQKIDSQDLDIRVADADGNGRVDSTDARLILQYAVKKIAQLPAGSTVTVQTGEAIETDTRTHSSNSFAPTDVKAGTPFDDLADLPLNKADSGSAAFGYFAFTTEDNEHLPFSVACYDSGDSLTAMLPAGVDLSAMIPTFHYYGNYVLMNGRRMVSGETVLDLTAPVTLTLTAQNGQNRTATLLVETLDTGLPSVALTMEDMAEITTKYEYAGSTFYLGGAGEEAVLVTSRAKGRGNSTWGHPKKSYTVKLDKKTTLLGLSKSKDWVLSANYEDKTLLRNIAAAYLAKGTDQAWVPSNCPVDLWYNGVYWGTYNLAEKIEIESDRVDITEYEEGMAPGESGFLLEFDGHVAEQQEQWIRPLGEEYALYYNPVTDEMFMEVSNISKWLTIKDPDYEDLMNNPEQMRYIYNRVVEAMAALDSSDYTRMEAYFDVRSFCQWYLVEEFMNNTDSAFHSSCYMTLDAGGKFTMGPIWDFDRSSNNCYYWNAEEDISCLYNHPSAWFYKLFSTSQARAILLEEYAVFRERVETLPAYIEEMADSIYAAQQYNFMRWPILTTMIAGPGENDVWNEMALAQKDCQTFEAEVARLNAYFARTTKKMDKFMASLE